MTSKTRIAVIVAALFLGAHAGIAALNQEAAETAEATEAAQELQTAEAPATEAPAAEAPQAAEAVVEAPQPEVIVRVRVEPVFTARGEEPWEILPRMAAYLDQRATEQSRLVARGDSFPRSEETAPMLPVMAAYLEQRDASRIARAQAPTVAAVEAQTVATAPAAGTSN